VILFPSPPVGRTASLKVRVTETAHRVLALAIFEFCCFTLPFFLGFEFFLTETLAKFPILRISPRRLKLATLLNFFFSP